MGSALDRDEHRRVQRAIVERFGGCLACYMIDKYGDAKTTHNGAGPNCPTLCAHNFTANSQPRKDNE